MNIVIYVSEKHKSYLPFVLYQNIIYNIFKKHSYNAKFITTLDNIENDTILFAYIIDISENNNFKDIQNIIDKNITTILINTEKYQNCNITQIINMINNNKHFYIFEYSPVNMKYFSENFNLQIHYIPLLYHIYLEKIYNVNVIHKIEYSKKNIDILFFGAMNNRRMTILQELSRKYKVIHYCCTIDNNKLMNLIEESKIVLNINYYENTFVFDYYRNAFLIANKTVIISEYPEFINFEIEYNLKDIEKNMILSTYENMIKTVQTYFMHECETFAKKQAQKQYDWFVKNNMETRVIDFVEKNMNKIENK